jgi:hypothetical protein
MKTSSKKYLKIPSFEEILKLYYDLDTDDKMVVFNQKLKLYLSDKTAEEKKFVGKILLSLTRDYADMLLKSLEKKGNINALEDIQKMLLGFTPSV